MKITVITVAYNSAATIADTAASVLAQEHAAVEYLVIDGGSTDATVAELEPFQAGIEAIVSEPDQGMYDAMNKGVQRASGEVIAILNSDDVYADAAVLARVAEVFADPAVDCVYGDLHYVAADDLNQVVRDWRSGPYRPSLFARGWHPPHPAFFVRRAVYEAVGGFDLSLRIAADYEFMLRVLHKYRCRVAYLPAVLVKMRTGGASNQSLTNILQANRECYSAWRINGYGVLTGLFAILCKPLRKLRQFARRAPRQVK